MNMISIGYGNFINADQVIAIINPESAPVKRMVSDAKDNGTAVDSTFGRRTRAVIVMSSGQIVLAPIQPQTIIEKSQKSKKDM